MPYSNWAGQPLAIIDDASKKQYINSFCITQQGSWLISVTTGEVAGSREHYTYTRRSIDRGRTWEPRARVFDGKPIGAAMDCEMGQLVAVPTPLGPDMVKRIYQFHIVKDTTQATRFGRLSYTYSEDDGCTWRGPEGPNSVYWVDAPAYALAPAKNGWHLMAPGLIMSNGEWILPIAVSTDPKKLADIRAETVFLVCRNILTAEDPASLAFEFFPPPPHGVEVPLLAAPGESLGHEPQVVELANRRLMCVMRTGNGYIAYTVSDDYGRTWRPTAPLRYAPEGPIIPNPNCPCPFTRLTDGKYALLYCNNDGTGNGGSGPFDASRNRNPVYISIGREIKTTDDQPLMFTAPRLLTHIEDFRPDVRGRDLSYGFFLEDQGEYYHFYNAVWQAIQVNMVDPGLTRF